MHRYSVTAYSDIPARPVFPTSTTDPKIVAQPALAELLRIEIAAPENHIPKVLFIPAVRPADESVPCQAPRHWWFRWLFPAEWPSHPDPFCRAEHPEAVLFGTFLPSASAVRFRSDLPDIIKSRLDEVCRNQGLLRQKSVSAGRGLLVR